MTTPPRPPPDRIRSALDQVEEGVVLFDDEQRVCYLNPAGRDFLTQLLDLQGNDAPEDRSGPDIAEELKGTELGEALLLSLQGRQGTATVALSASTDSPCTVHLLRTPEGVTLRVRPDAPRALQDLELQHPPTQAEAPRRALRILEQAIDAVQVGVTIADLGSPDEPLVYVSEGFRRMTGYTQEESLGRNCRFLQGEETDPEAVARIRAALEAGESVQVTLRNYRKDRSAFWNRLSLSPVRTPDGRTNHYIGIQEDVTEHRRMGRQAGMADRLNSVGSLAGGIAHDMRNVLASAKLLLQLVLDRETLSDEAREDLQEADEVLSRGESVTSQLLAFAREQPLNTKVLDMGTVVRNRAQFLRRFLRDDISVSVDTRHDLWVEVDEGRLDQVIFNLATNAEQAMPQGGSLDFRVRGHTAGEIGSRVASLDPDPEDRYVVVSVEDDGEGMTEEVRAQAFDPFFTGRRQTGGTGLGLASVFGTMEQFGGTVWIESTPGDGTTLHLAFPRRDAPDAGTVSEVEPFSLPTRSLTILLAEDEASLRRTLAKALTTEGHHVLPATDGETARAILETRPDRIDLIISDIMMPGASGVELAEFGLELRPDLPILLMSGYSSEELGHLGRSVRFLSKPFELSTLLSIITAMTEAESRRTS